MPFSRGENCPSSTTTLHHVPEIRRVYQGRQAMDMQGLQNRGPLACAGRVLFRQ